MAVVPHTLDQPTAMRLVRELEWLRQHPREARVTYRRKERRGPPPNRLNTAAAVVSSAGGETFTLTANQRLAVDARVGNATVNLPASPTHDDRVGVFVGR